MRQSEWRLAGTLAVTFFLACSVQALLARQSSNAAQDGQSQPSVAAPQFKPIPGAPEGVEEARLFSHSLPRAHARLEIRTIVVPAGKPVSFAAENEGLFELRAGTIATVSEGKKEKRERGEIWQLAKGSRIELEASGELAVVRAIYLLPDEK